MAEPTGAEDERLQRALLAHLRQEFTAPAAAILGYAEMLIEDAQRLELAAFLPDLERIRTAGGALQDLLQAVLAREADLSDRSKLRHDLRTPMNAIKGYGEMLVEDALEAGHEALVADLSRLLGSVQGVLARIDALVDFTGHPKDRDAAALRADEADVGGTLRVIRKAGLDHARHVGHGRILVVDDNAANRDLLGRRLERAGHQVTEADGGVAALELLERESFDLVLLDLIMPEVTGYEVLTRMKSQPATADIPVIMISAIDDLDSIVRCIEAGAVDYLPKPFDPTLLYARIGATLENKFLRDREKLMLAEIKREKERSENLLLSILPQPIVDRINAGASMIADNVGEATILFADIVNFTPLAGRVPADDLVVFLDRIFTAFDLLAERHGAEKIKTIGDAYMAAVGLLEQRPDQAEAAAALARAMLEVVEEIARDTSVPIALRIGIHTGPAIAGVIGRRKFSYDVWGNTVNIASRMESHGKAGRIHISQAVARRLEGLFELEDRGEIDVKGSGRMRTYFLGAPRPAECIVEAQRQE
jgi:class 3 adenylate cyclase